MTAAHPVVRVSTRAQLQGVADALGVRADWHEPDEQEVTAVVHGDNFDNAGFWGHDSRGTPVTFGEGQQEMWIELRRDGHPVAEVNLATLLAWATGQQD
jgi:hypothetical protein